MVCTVKLLLQIRSKDLSRGTNGPAGAKSIGELVSPAAPASMTHQRRNVDPHVYI